MKPVIPEPRTPRQLAAITRALRRMTTPPRWSDRLIEPPPARESGWAWAGLIAVMGVVFFLGWWAACQ